MKRSELVTEASRILTRRGKPKLAAAMRKLGARAGKLTPAIAEKMGKKAYHAGKPASPGKEFMDMLYEVTTKVGDAIPYLKAWQRGWQRECGNEMLRSLKEMDRERQEKY